MTKNHNKYVAKNNDKTAHRIIDGEAVVVNLTDSTFHTLNPVATFIWQHADGQTSVKEIVQKVCQEFEVDWDIAEKDCLELITELVNKGMLILSPHPLEEG
jgi:hypothetical protein